MTPEYRCADCGKELLEDERPCSKCGGVARNISIVLTDKVGVSDNSFKAKVKNPDIPGTKYELTKKKKQSGKTKKPAEETMIIDRSHPEKTIKKHKVREFDGENWKTVHDEHEEFPAKRRKKTSGKPPRNP